MKTRIKICGLTNYADAKLSADLGAYALGFIFAEESPRYISKKHAAEILAILRESLPTVPKIVGVFVNMPAEEVANYKRELSLDYVQLHGEETLTEYTELKPLVKSFHLESDKSLDRAIDLSENCDSVLLDSRAGNQRGGTGQVADWTLASKLCRQRKNIILAGGLGPSNILEACRSVPDAFAYDLSSGVEASPGVKDHEKLKQLFANTLVQET